MLTAIRNCEFLLLLLTKNADASKEVKKEVLQAEKLGKAIIPVIVEDGVPTDELDFQLSRLHFVDARGRKVSQWGLSAKRAIQQGPEPSSQIVAELTGSGSSELTEEEATSTINWEFAELEFDTDFAVEAHIERVLQVTCEYLQPLVEHQRWDKCSRSNGLGRPLAEKRPKRRRPT